MMTRQEQQRQRLQRALQHVFDTELAWVSRLPRQTRDREVLRRARTIAAKGGRMAISHAAAHR
jgi:hypothetical protein